MVINVYIRSSVFRLIMPWRGSYEHSEAERECSAKNGLGDAFLLWGNVRGNIVTDVIDRLSVESYRATGIFKEKSGSIGWPVGATHKIVIKKDFPCHSRFISKGGRKSCSDNRCIISTHLKEIPLAVVGLPVIFSVSFYFECRHGLTMLRIIFKCNVSLMSFNFSSDSNAV